MLWSTLYNSLGRKHMKITRHQHVHMLSVDPANGKEVITFLELRHDTQGNPYLIKSQKDFDDPHRPLKTHKNGNNDATERENTAPTARELKYDLNPVRGGWIGCWTLVQPGSKTASLTTGEFGERPIVFESEADAVRYRSLVTDGLTRLLNQATGMDLDEARDYFAAQTLYEIKAADGTMFDDDQLVYVVSMG